MAAAAAASSTQPTPLDMDCVSEYEKSQLADPVQKCLVALEAAETDTEKFAALFLVPKLVNKNSVGVNLITKNDRLQLMKGIGYSFLTRMLRSKEAGSSSDAGCPPLMYQSVALSVLSCFTDDDEIMTHPSVLFNLPVLLDIVRTSDNDIYDNNLVVIADTYRCLTAIVCNGSDEGRKEFVSNRGVQCLCGVVIRQSFCCDQALNLLLAFLSWTTTSETSAWSYGTGVDDFNLLMSKLCDDFVTSTDLTKFELCDAIHVVLRSLPKSKFANQDDPWLAKLQKGMRDILFSKIGQKQRESALILAAAVIDVSAEENFDVDESRCFQIVCNLACIEVLMQLEDRKLDDNVLDKSELLVACYFIIESAVSRILVAEDQVLLDAKQKVQLCLALKNAFSAVIRFLRDVSNCPAAFKDQKSKYFICATIRLLGAWLAEETLALREDVYAILPFVITVATETFYSLKLPKLQTFEVTEETTTISRQSPPDTLRFLLPALCHLVVEERSRKIVIDMKLHEMLYAYLSYHWSIYDGFKRQLRLQMNDNAKFEMINSKHAITTLCNVLLNLTVLEPQFVKETSVFSDFFKFIIDSLDSNLLLEKPNDDVDDVLILYGNLSTLGLLLLKNLYSHEQSVDHGGLRKFIQAVVRFLWDAHNAEESLDEEEFCVSANYCHHWPDLVDLWHLGMQVLADVLVRMSWVADFIMETGWPQHVLQTLSKVRRGGIDSDITKTAYEELLCSLLKQCGGSNVVHDEFSRVGVSAVCQTHKLKDLADLISSREQRKP